MDIFAARLFAINVRSATLGMIHRKILDLQNVSTNLFKKSKQAMVDSAAQTEEDKKAFMGPLELLSKKGFRVLWTKDQLNVLYGVWKILSEERSDRRRILIRGCKGSGKTLIMKQIALIAASEPGIKKIVVGNGNGERRSELFESLQQYFKGTGIMVASNRAELEEKAKGCHLLLVDEFYEHDCRGIGATDYW